MTETNVQGSSELPDKCDPVPALAALYQGEKTDASNVLNTAMAMMGIAVVYLVSSMPFLNNVRPGLLGWIFLLMVPLPLWLIAGYHSLMTITAMSHGVSVRIIEQALFEVSELRVKNDLVGSAAGDKIMDITQSKPIHRLTTRIVYFGVAAMVAGYTGYALYLASAVNNVSFFHVRAIWIAILFYLFLAGVVARSWIVGLRIINEASALAKRYPPWSERRNPQVH